MASKSLLEVAENMKIYADLRRRPTPKHGYELNSLVWLDTRDLNTGRPSKKLDVKRTGPFKIIKIMGPLNYKLELPPSWRIHPVFHVSKLRPTIVDKTLHPDEIDDSLRPPPVLIDDEEEYNVNKILTHTGNG